MKMKALLLDKPGFPEQLRIGDAPVPEPQRGEVRVRVKAVGLNPVDYKLANSGHSEWKYPFIIGLDIAGCIDAIGEGVEGFHVGNRVVYHGDLTKNGGFAEYAIAQAHVISKIPDTVFYEEAAALPCAGYTAYVALEKLNARAGETILVHGGAGGVGGFAIQLASLAGLKIITTASANHHAYVKKIGAHYPIDYNSENVTERIMEITEGRGVHAALDTVGRANATATLDMLSHNGRIAYVSGNPDFNHIRPFTKAISYHEFFFAIQSTHARIAGRKNGIRYRCNRQ